MPFTLRSADSQREYERIAALMRIDNPHSIASAATLRDDEAAAPAGSIFRTVVAEEEPGAVSGFSYLGRMSWAPAGAYRLQIIVDPPFRNRGVGSRLWDDALTYLTGQRAGSVKASVADDCPEYLRFAEHRGFTVWRHIFESALDLTTFDESRFAGSIERVEADGIRFFSLDDLGDTADARRRFYELRARTGLDTPRSDGTYPPYEQFHAYWFERPIHHPAGCIVAADGDEWVGLAMVGYVEETREAFNGFTGVLPPYRGRGIALALKLLANRYAIRRGAREIGTGNDSSNEPMLAINRKLGYMIEPGTYGVERKLGT